MRKSWLLLLAMIGISCSADVPPPPATAVHAIAAGRPTLFPAPVATQVPARPAVLDWEIGHPERTAWSAALIANVNEHFVSFAGARDVSEFHPRWGSLTRDQQTRVLAEMIVWTAYYESGWKPGEFSVDVGSANDNRTWSVGLLQLSVVDQANYHLAMGYSFNDLQDPIKNLHLGVAIMAKQIDRHGKILIPAGEAGVYWSTLHPGGRHDKSAAIEAHTRATTFSE